jgi:hypothetical protein
VLRHVLFLANSTENTPSNSSQNSSFSVLLCSPSNRPTEYTCKKIEILMKQQSDRYALVNNSNEQTSKCWYLFDFLALIEFVGKQTKIIEKFVTCHHCFTTYSFKFNSNHLLNKYLCKRTTRAWSVSLSDSLNSSPTYHQRSLTSYETNTKCDQQ